jgi:hypothetical protein
MELLWKKLDSTNIKLQEILQFSRDQVFKAQLQYNFKLMVCQDLKKEAVVTTELIRM